MVIRLRAFFLTMILSVAFLAALPVDTTTPVAAQGDDELQHYRSWSIGDYWRYDMKAAANNPAGTKAEITERVQSVERVTNDMFFDPEKYPASWQHHQAFRVKVWANMTANSGHGATMIKTEQTKFHRTADLGLVQMHQSDSFNFIENPAQNSGAERFREYYPPELEFDFPFAVDDKWRIATTVRAHDPTGGCGQEGMPSCNTTDQKVYTYTVLGKEVLNMKLNGKDVRVSTYKMLRIDELGIEDADNLDAKKYEVRWWSPEVCNWVKKESFNAKNELRQTWTLKDYKCQGRDAPDPTYAIYDYKNFSSIRRHGELAIPDRLALFNKAFAQKEAAEGGPLVQLGEQLPGPHALVVVALVAAMAFVVRRRL